MPNNPRLFALLFLALTMLAPHTCSAAQRFVWFGTYTGQASKGIYVSTFDDSTGKLGEPKLAAELASPSFLALHPNGKVLYSVHEIDNFGGKKVGGLSAFTIQSDGALKLINAAGTGGPGPCQVTVDATGQCVMAANYGGGSVISYKLKADGGIGEQGSFHQHAGSSVNPDRQKEPHAHCIRLSPDNKYAYVCDLGLDRVVAYELDPVAGKLTTAKRGGTVAPGSGPRHLAAHPKNGNVYVLNEILCTVTVFAHDPKADALVEKQTLSTLPADEQRKPEFSTAEIVLHPSGKFLYASNRGHHSIAVFEIAPEGGEKAGQLTLIQNAPTLGKTPRNFNVDPSGKWLLAANQDSDSVIVFAIDPATGKLTPADQNTAGTSVKVGRPVCVVFGPEIVK